MRALIFLALMGGPALASSGDASAAFRVGVGAACLSLVEGPGTATVQVNPFGSESHGEALVTLGSAAGSDRMVCVYDKATGRADLSAPFGA